ncbi:MAG: gliding motility lipoprotein GldB [Bacteroidia bacterium]
MNKTSFQILLSTVLVLISSCGGERKNKTDVSGITIQQPFLRFDKDLFSCGDSITANDLAALRNKYGTFFTIFCNRLIRIPASEDSSTAVALTHFISDSDVKHIYHLTDSIFSNTDKIQKELLDAFKHYAFYFPQKNIPDIVTYISAFNYQVITTDSTVGIGLDMYLGAENEDMYGSIGIPKYMFRKFSKEYIVSDCIKGWFQSEYENDSVKSELLSQMIYHGKLLYFTQMLAPALSDTVVIGYTKDQLAWCIKSESNIWAHLIENNLLYSTVIQEYIKFINDGPTTNGLPAESPAKLGSWLGWQIVKAYVKSNPEITLEQLLDEKDAQKILNDSKYKPEK